MSKNHRNSQKRIYLEGAIYFITICTFNKYPYFMDDAFCELFVEELSKCQKIDGFNLYGYKINPEHVHIMFMPKGEKNYSEIVRSIKTNFSRNVNRLICPFYKNDEIKYMCHLKARSRDLAFMCNNFIGKYVKIKNKFHANDGKMNCYTKFKWQSSFYDHYIRDKKDLDNHIEYLKNQWQKHGLNENKWLNISNDL